MHILLALLGAIVTILVLLSRLADAGISLGGLNPFLWRRRRAWRTKYEANPLFTLEDPMAIAALLALGVAKAEGDMSADERRALLGEFETTFSRTPRQASELLTASAHLLGDGQAFRERIDDVLTNAKERLSGAQLDSVLPLLERVAAIGGAASAQRRQLLDLIRNGLAPAQAQNSTWA